MMMVKAGGYTEMFERFIWGCVQQHSVELWTAVLHHVLLTEIKDHADEDDKAEPGVEIRDEVDDGDDNIGDGWEDTEHYVAVENKRQVNHSFVFFSTFTISHHILYYFT